MIGLVTTLSTIETQPLSAKAQLEPSKSYLINTDNILDFKLYSTDDTEILYSLNIDDDRELPFRIFASQTNAQVAALADVSAASNVLSLGIFPNSESFSDIANDTSETHYFALKNVVWGEADSTTYYTRMLVKQSGGLKVYFVDAGLAEIMDLADTGTTSTTTSTTTGA